MTDRVNARSRHLLFVCVTAAVLAATGCSAGEESPEHPFDGPWGSEFASMHDESKSAFVRAVLEDGSISEQEFSEMKDRYASCLAKAQIVFSSFDRDGAAEVSFPPSVSADEAHRKMADCSTSSGESPIGALYAWIHRNPEHRDEDTIMAECLVRLQAVPPGYDAGQYAKDTSAGSWPFIDPDVGRARLEDCIADPLGLFENQ